MKETEIKEITEEFFNKMTLEADNISVTKRDDYYLIEVEMGDPKMLIGERGQVLSELQYILRIIVRKRLDEETFIELDINEYKKKKKESLKSIADDIAGEVILRQKEKILPAMNPYERRIIHLALKDREGIKTESIGEGDERKVVIRPA